MNLELYLSTEYLFILGAGASVEYGLPLWKDLDSLIRNKLNNDSGNSYQYKKEILAWIEKIGTNKEHKTLDQCISTESVSDFYPNGDDIENQIFQILKEIFDEHYKKEVTGWIRKFNDSILLNQQIDPTAKIAFINYNYDRVLDDLFLNYTYLHKKHIRYTHRERLMQLENTIVKVLYPHGNLYRENELDSSAHTNRYVATIKSHDDSQLDAVSCYESKKHLVYKANRVSKFKLYILGLGGGLETNLNNINLINSISEIHVTIKDSGLHANIVNFLSNKYKIPETEIHTYPSCEKLIDTCFPILKSE
jgi:hypothetical protein